MTLNSDVVEDVIHDLKDKGASSDDRLSGVLSAGCDGPGWVGEGRR